MQEAGNDFQSGGARRRTEGPSGISGWLILPLIGLATAPLYLGWMLYTDYLPIFSEEVWRALGDPNFPGYHPYLQTLAVFELVANATVMLASAILLVMFLRRHHAVPLLVIALFSFNAMFVLVDAALVRRIPVLAQEIDLRWNLEVWSTLLEAAVWIPYFLTSKRVKNTFIN